MHLAYVHTPIGVAQLQGDANGLASIMVLDIEKPTVIVPEILEDAVHQLSEYFKGQRTQFHLQLNPLGTAFQKKVWQALRQIPFGTTLSYAQLAKQLGQPKAIRAVAAANGKNPLWIVVPCHRVIGSNGTLVGYAGGLYRKKWLLHHEGLAKQTTLF